MPEWLILLIASLLLAFFAEWGCKQLEVWLGSGGRGGDPSPEEPAPDTSADQRADE